MEKGDFVEIFHIAFPSRPEDRVNRLAEQLANSEGKIAMSTMLVLFYLFCDGKTEDNLSQMFNMFDMDGNKVITIDELLNMMSVFIEIGEGKGHKVDLATVMAEMFKIGDRNNDDLLTREEFVNGMLEHPVTSRILMIKKIDAILDTM